MRSRDKSPKMVEVRLIKVGKFPVFVSLVVGDVGAILVSDQTERHSNFTLDLADTLASHIEDPGTYQQNNPQKISMSPKKGPF